MVHLKKAIKRNAGLACIASILLNIFPIKTFAQSAEIYWWGNSHTFREIHSSASAAIARECGAIKDSVEQSNQGSSCEIHVISCTGGSFSLTGDGQPTVPLQVEVSKVCGGTTYPNILWGHYSVHGEYIPASHQDENGGECPSSEHPITFTRGNKYFEYTDYTGAGVFPLRFKRVYNSQHYRIKANPQEGYQEYLPAWSHTYNRAIRLVNGTKVVARRHTGNAYVFNQSGAEWVGATDIPDRLEEIVDEVSGERTGWRYRIAADEVETYNATGQLISIANRQGLTHTLSYVDNGQDYDSVTQITVQDSNNNSLVIAYENGVVTQMTEPDGNLYRYEYDTENSLVNRLIRVVYPDNTPMDVEDNPYLRYHYEDSEHPYRITRITNEEGVTQSLVTYNSEGRAISSELAEGSERTSVDYTNYKSNTDSSVTVTNELGKKTTYHFSPISGVMKLMRVEGHPSTNCAGANKNYTYDANGYRASATDWNGITTTYIHDNKGRETSRTEAVGMPQERTITTEWHNEFRLPVKITEPERITVFTYDEAGQLLTKTVKPRVAP